MFPRALAAILSLPEGFELRYGSKVEGAGCVFDHSRRAYRRLSTDHVSGSLTVAARDAASGAIPAVARLR